MQSSWDLNALVAEKVMGWTRSTRYPNGEPFKPYRGPEWGLIRPDGMWMGHHIPEYSTHVAAAEEVLGKLEQTFLWTMRKLKNGNYRCIIFEKTWSGRSKTHKAISDSKASAICLAALRAAGVEI